MGLESLTKVPRPAGLLGDSSQHPVVILLLLLKREREEGNGTYPQKGAGSLRSQDET